MGWKSSDDQLRCIGQAFQRHAMTRLVKNVTGPVTPVTVTRNSPWRAGWGSLDGRCDTVFTGTDWSCFKWLRLIDETWSFSWHNQPRRGTTNKLFPIRFILVARENECCCAFSRIKTKKFSSRIVKILRYCDFHFCNLFI